MASINLVVNVVITKGSQTVPLPSFSIPVIFGPSNRFGDPFRIYTDPAAMLLDGFLTSDPEYIHAVALMSQAKKPTSFYISKFTAAVAQVDTFTVSTLVDSHNYTFTLNSVVITFNSGIGATQQSVLDGLNAAVVTAFPVNPPVLGVRTGTGAGAILTFTSTVPGAGVSYTAIDADLAHLNPVANHSIAQDIAVLQAIDDKWYGVIVTSKVASDIEQIAAYIETQLKLYGAASSDAGILTTSTTDVATVLKNKGYTRTWLLYSAEATSGADAAWMGRMLPTTPGSSNWKFKQLVGIDSDNLNPTQISNAQGKNANLYLPIGVDTTIEGVVASGEFIDVTVFLDWLPSTMKAAVLQVLVDNEKVPYTNKGIVTIENPVNATLQLGQDNGGLAPGWTVSGPDVNSVPTNDKKTRTLNNVTFNATLAGAINKVNINGFVSV